MKIQYVVPTHARAAKQLTLRNLPQSIREQVLVVTSTKEDAKQIRELYNHDNIVTAKNTTGIASKRHWIMKNVDADHIFFMDDDLDFYQRCEPKHRELVDGLWKLRADCKPDTYLLYKPKKLDRVEKVFSSWIPKMAEKHAVVGLSSRMGNNRVEESVVKNTRIMHAFGVSRDAYLSNDVRFDAVKYREDFHVALSLLRKGLSNIVYYDVCCAPGTYGAPGGTSTERTVEASNLEAEKLAKLHPGLVKVVDRAYDGTPRKEVIISWKKAYESSKG